MRKILLLLTAFFSIHPVFTAFSVEAEKRTHPRVFFLIGEAEYDTKTTLPAFAKAELEPRGIECIFSMLPSEDSNDFPNIAALNDADLLFVSVRRHTPPRDQMDAIRAFVASGKPVVGIRTASHAFALRAGAKPSEGFGDWPEFDHEVLGGNYHDHYGKGIPTFAKILPEAAGHPVLAGIGADEFRVPSHLYRNPDLPASVTKLLTARMEGRPEAEPVAWVNTAKARVFYTSLGSPEDFGVPQFRQLLVNGVLWALDLPKLIRAGIIGLDTSHAIAFTQTLNAPPKNPADAAKVAGVKVVAAYPQGSRDIESSTKRVPEYTEKVKTLGVEIVDSVEDLVNRVDVVFLESNDGRVHLDQVKPVLAAGKPVFIDKPLAGSLADTIRILDAARKANVPMFCSSSLRFGRNTQAVRNGAIGKVKSAETFSPAHLEPTHPDLYWYGVHGCESLFTVMGTGCISVKRGTTADGKIEVTGTWPDGRTGVFREENGQDRKGYGGKAIGETGESPIGSYDGYDVLLLEIVKMFRTGVAPVTADEMIELYAFMEAADESKRRGGREVTLKEVLDKTRAEVASQP